MKARSASWFIVVPPEGAARESGFETSRAFEDLLGKDSCRIFDSKKYLDFFNSQLKHPEETLVVDLFNHALAVQCLDFGAANCLVCALSPVTPFILNLLRAHGVATSHWFYEDYRRAQYWKYVLAGYDYFFAIQKGPLPEACRRAGSAYFFLPTAARSHCSAPTADADPPNRPTDIGFIGIPSPYRIEMLEFLAQKGFSLRVAGLGWDRYNGPLKDSIVNTLWTDGKKAEEILAASKIGINLSVLPPDSDRQNTHVGPRVFDVLAAGCVLITEDVPLAGDTLKNLHYLTFANKEDAARQSAEIMTHLDKDKPFLNSNRTTVCREHLYANRVMEILRLTDYT
jgi:Glycosyl transferases group 1